MSSENTAKRFERLIEDIVGLPITTIRQQDPEQTDKFIEDRLTIKLQLGKPDPRIEFRGNPLLAMGRIIYDIDAEFNQKFEKYDEH
jgi:hypothetical protein